MQIRLFLCRNLIQTDQPHFGKTSCRIFVEYRHVSVSFNNSDVIVKTEKNAWSICLYSGLLVVLYLVLT
jgi:hypothetical protein